MPIVHSPWIQAGIDWLRGDDAIMYKQVPEEVGKRHVTELLHQHPFHPFDPEIHKDKDHMCYKENLTFFQCMASMDENMKLHMKHVNCYHPYKTDLMKCLVKWRRAQKQVAEAAAEKQVVSEGTEQK
jgi:hypothetical protein